MPYVMLSIEPQSLEASEFKNWGGDEVSNFRASRRPYSKFQSRHGKALNRGGERIGFPPASSVGSAVIPRAHTIK